MNRILGIAILLSFASMAWGQSSGNPFDLKYRPAKPKAAPVVKSPDSLSKTVITQPVTKTLPAAGKPAVDTVRMPVAALPGDTTSPAGKNNPFDRAEQKDSGHTTVIAPLDTQAQKPAIGKILPQVPKTRTSKGFQIFFMLLSLLLLIFIVNVERSFVRDLWRVISNENYSSLHHRNQRNTMRQILLMMGYSVFIIQAGLFIYHALQVYHYSGTLLDNIWVSIALVLCIYLTRHGVLRYLRWLFNNEKELTLYGFDISIFNTMVGLVLLPVNVLIIFGPENLHKPLVIIGIIAISAAYLLRQLRWMLTARQLIANSLFLFFVYLCAVEILPLWAISKLFW
jgi:hypothetical protein